MRLHEAQTKADVAELLGESLKRVNYVLHVLPPTGRYSEFRIPKRNGEHRTIHAPVPLLLRWQRIIKLLLEEGYEPSRIAHGGLSGRSITSNASRHVGKRWVASIDLQDFFPSINFGRVRGLFLKSPYVMPQEVATLIAQLCCHEGALPQGAPSSSIIANILCRSLDRRLQSLGRKFGFEVTRYVDDITLSTNRQQFHDEILAKDSGDGGEWRPGSSLAATIDDNGFKVNLAKVEVKDRSRRQVVTGLVVNSRIRPIPRIREETDKVLHIWQRFGRAASQAYLDEVRKVRFAGLRRTTVDVESFIEGRLAYLLMIVGPADSHLRRLSAKFAEVNGGSRFPKLQTEADLILSSLVVVNCGTVQGTGFFLDGLGLVTCSHVMVEEMGEVHFRDTEGDARVASVRRRVEALDVVLLESNLPPRESLRPDSRWIAEPGKPIAMYGFPNFAVRDSGVIERGHVAGVRVSFSQPRFLVGGAKISPGQSGGPVLNAANRVVGIAVRGAGESEPTTEKHEVLSIRPVLAALADK